MAKPLVPCWCDLLGDVGVLGVARVLDYAAHSTWVECVTEFPVGVALEVKTLMK